MRPAPRFSTAASDPIAATLITAPDLRQPHLLLLPDPAEASGVREEIRLGLGLMAPEGDVILEAADRRLRLPELRAAVAELDDAGLRLVEVRARHPQTIVAAAALGLETRGHREPIVQRDDRGGQPPLTVHHGTLRSGDHLEAGGSALVLGDVNPGARISATGHVLVWGRLRGMAHAGREGDGAATIVALQLRPLQLRIASVVARGPEDIPPPGLAERARLVEGTIHIEPAPPGWPAVG